MNINKLVTTSALMGGRELSTPSAWLGHIPFGSWLVETTQPQVLVELGTHFGHSYFAFCDSVLKNDLTTHCYAVDTWQGDVHAGQYSDEIFLAVKHHHDNNYSAFSRLLRMTFDEAVIHFSDRSIDFLHIDGLHTYEAVLNDFNTWLPKLSNKAVVLFHDTNVRERDFGVWKLWEELSAKYPSIHFDHSHGLGVLFIGKDQPLEVCELLNEWRTSGGQNIIRQFFAKLGQCVELEYRVAEQRQAITMRDNQIVTLNQTLAAREGDLAVIMASASWRLTAYLRKLRALFRG